LDRLDLIKTLLGECVLSSTAVNTFLDKPRDYFGEDSNLYMRDVHFVVAVGPEGHPTMSEMAHRLNVTQSAVTPIVIRLERKGYLLRSKDTEDKRVTILSLTEKGKQLCSEHLAYDRSRYQAVSEGLKDFSDEELERLIYYERCMKAIFTKRTRDGCAK